MITGGKRRLTASVLALSVVVGTFGITPAYADKSDSSSDTSAKKDDAKKKAAHENRKAKELLEEYGINQDKVEESKESVAKAKKSVKKTKDSLEKSKNSVKEKKKSLSDSEGAYEELVKETQDLEDEVEALGSRLFNSKDELNRIEENQSETKKDIGESKKSVGRMASTMYKSGGATTTGLSGYLMAEGDNVNQKVNANYMLQRVMKEREGTLQNQKELESVQESSKNRQTAVKSEIQDMHEDMKDMLKKSEDKRDEAEAQKKRFEKALKDAKSAQASAKDAQSDANKAEDNARKARGKAKDAESDAKERYDKAVRRAKVQAETFKEMEAKLIKEAKLARVSLKDEAEVKKLMKSMEGSGAFADIDFSEGEDSDEMFPLANPSAVTKINSSFGWRSTPAGTIDYGGQGGYVHSGTDFAAPCGTPIRAAADGKVWLAGAAGSSGNAVGLSHGVVNGFTFATRYHHLTKATVSTGDKVKRGEVIGISGTTGNSTGCHLHFETLVNGDAVNPMTFLK